MWILGNEFSSSIRVLSVLNRWVTSPTRKLHILYVRVPRKTGISWREKQSSLSLYFSDGCGHVWHKVVGTQRIFIGRIGLCLVCLFSSSCQWCLFYWCPWLICIVFLSSFTVMRAVLEQEALAWVRPLLGLYLCWWIDVISFIRAWPYCVEPEVWAHSSGSVL